MIRFDLHFRDGLHVDDFADRGEEFCSCLRDPSFYEEFSLIILHEGHIVFDELPLVPLDLLGQLLNSLEPFVAGNLLIAGEEEETWIFYTDGKAAEFARCGFDIYSAYNINGEPFLVTAADLHEAKARDELYWSLRMDLGSWLKGVAQWGSQFVRAVNVGRSHLIKEAQRRRSDDLLNRTHELFSHREELDENSRKIRDWLASRSPYPEFLEVIEA